MEDGTSKENSKLQSTCLTGSPSENSRLLDELSVANQLMALAKTPEIFTKSEFQSIQSTVDFEETLSSDQQYLENQSFFDLRSYNDPPEPETLEELIQVEHSYALSCISQDYHEEEEQLASKALQEKNSTGKAAISCIKTEVECGEQSLTKIMTVNILKEGKNEKSIVCKDIYPNEANVAHINEENNYDFQKKLRVILKDCQTDTSLSVQYNMNQNMILSSSDSDKISKRARLSCDSNNPLGSQPIKKRKIIKSTSLDGSECVLQNLKLQNASKSKVKQTKVEHFIAGIKSESSTKNVLNVNLRNVETNATTKNDNSKLRMNVHELKIKPAKLLSMSVKNRKSIETIGNHQAGEKMLSLRDFKSTASEKKNSLEEKEVILLSPNVTKCNKKKAIKREMSRFVVNKDEPPLFSQPDMMIKIATEDSLKKEIKDSDMNALEDSLKKEIKDSDMNALEDSLQKEIKDSDMNVTEDSLKKEIKDNDMNAAEDSLKEEIKDSEMKIELEEVPEFEHISIRKSGENINSAVNISHNSILNIETKNTNFKFETSKESKHLKESSLIENNGFIEKVTPLKNNECISEKNTLDLFVDNPLHKNNESEELCQDNVDEKGKNDLLCKKNDSEELCQNIVDKRGKDDPEDLDQNILDKKKQNDSVNLSDAKSQSSTADAEIKPGRKSSRLIKKKEFFEFVSEPPIAPAAKKKNIAQKPKKEKLEKISKCISDIDENEVELEEEEDDPDKLWCICRKPHNNRFMIQCDTCEDWFHGTCVGVTKQQGVQLEKQEKEWICPSCCSKDLQVLESPKETLPSPVKNKGIKKLKKKEPEKDTTNKNILCNKNKQIGKNLKVGVDIKSNISSLEKHRKNEHLSLEKHQKSNSPLDVHLKNQGSNLEREKKCQNSLLERHSKNQSSPMEKCNKNQEKNCENPTDKQLTKVTPKKLQDKINVLSKKSNKTFLLKNASPKKLSKGLPISKTLFSKDSKINTIKKENKSSKDTLSQSIEKTPQQKSKSKEIKTVQKNRHNCIQCQNIAEANSCYCSSECIEKHAMQCIKTMRGADSKDWDSQRLVVFDRYKGNVITGEKGPKAKEIISWLKENPSFMIACSSSTISGSKKDLSCKKECDSSTNLEKEKAKVNDVRLNVKKTLKNILMDRCKNSDDIILSEEEIRKIAAKIEEELYAQFKDTNLKYRTKYRSLMFNIKDPRNQGLFRKILRGEIAPDQVVHMTATELASVELSKWREQEMQHHLDMIKRVQLEQQKSGSVLKKTHKGEVEIEDDITIIEQDVLKAVPKNDADESFDIDKDEQDTSNDTTQLHRSHLFDLNCKICTGKVVPPPDESIPKKVRIAHSISVDASSPNTVEFVSRATEKKSSVSTTEDDSLDQEPTSTVSLGSPNSVEDDCQITEPKSLSSVWKGFIFMQDIAKFVTSAYKVSGQTDRLHSDLPDTIQVCGRIIPDQVWDYISKIKQSGNKELIIIQFQAANDEEAVTYNKFYSYLNSRKRYGVVSNYSRKIKDFYIVPLAATSPVPTVLMPFDGPGLPSPRPHLLLGVIVRHKAKQTPQVPVANNTVSKANESDAGSYTPPFEPRSYTPPLPAIDEQPLKAECSSPSKTNKNFYDNKTSFTLNKCQEKKSGNYKTFPLLKNKNEVTKLPTKGDKDKPYDPEQDIVILSAEECGRKKENLEDQKKILDALTKQLEETDREVSALKHFASAPKSSTNRLSSISDDISTVVESGMTSFLDIPENLQEILNTVRLKSRDSELKRDVDMRDKLSFGFQDAVKEIEDKTTPPSEEFEKPYPSDPRIKLRTPYQEVSFITPGSQDEISSTKNSIKIVMQQSTSTPQHSSSSIPQQSSTSMRLMPTNWNQFREPPPPGIEPPELLVPDVFQSKPDDSVLKHASPPPPPPPLPHYVSSAIVQDKCLNFPPPMVSCQTHSMFPLPNIIQPSFAQPPLPIEASPSKGNGDQWTSGYQPKKEWNERQWSYSANKASGYSRKQTNKHWEGRHNRSQRFRRPLRGYKFGNRHSTTYKKRH